MSRSETKVLAGRRYHLPSLPRLVIVSRVEGDVVEYVVAGMFTLQPRNMPLDRFAAEANDVTASTAPARTAPSE